jgi:hypothetical protein
VKSCELYIAAVYVVANLLIIGRHANVDIVAEITTAFRRYRASRCLELDKLGNWLRCCEFFERFGEE